MRKRLRNAATIRCQLLECDHSARSKVDEFMFGLGNSFEKFLANCEWHKMLVEKPEFLENFKVLNVFRMAGPDEYYIHCLASDIYYFEILSNQILRKNREIGLYFGNIVTAVGIPMVTHQDEQNDVVRPELTSEAN